MLSRLIHFREEPRERAMLDPIRRQLKQRLESLRHSGVEFLPRASAPPPGFFSAVNAESGVAQAETESAKTGGPERRPIELQLLAERVSKCTRCPELASTRTQTVFGVGPLSPDLCFIGEAPGADEDRQGEPFVGAAGQLLNRIIAAMGMKREEVYICNILRCRPPGNRPPRSDEAQNCREYLDAQLELIAPKFICVLGATAAQNLLGSSLRIGEMRGKSYFYKDIPVICTYHPASLLPTRSPQNKKLVWDDMKMLLAKMGRPVPGT
jgi:uracil-DNA glycosylase